MATPSAGPGIEDDGHNVLLVVLDTVRRDHVGPYGHDRPTTPTLDRLAAEAVVYEQAIAQAPWTLPSHASMFTGRYPSQHGATQESPYLTEDGTLAAALSAAGYETALYSSNAWLSPHTGVTARFDDHDNTFGPLPGGSSDGVLAGAWQRLNDGRLQGLATRLVEWGNVLHERGSGGTRTPAVIDRTIEFVDATDRWFVAVNLMDAHLPYRPPEEAKRRFAPDVDPNSVCQNSKRHNSGARPIDEAEFADLRRLYDAEISVADRELGRLFDHLRSSGVWDDTVVIVCADHGELHGEFGLFGHEFAVYDPLVHVPLLLNAPGLDAGRWEAVVELLDIYDTVLDAATAGDRPESVGGRCFDPARSLLSDVPRTERPDGDTAFVEYHRPVVELRQLRSKAAEAGIDPPEEPSRFGSRMRAARRQNEMYIHNERIPDEARSVTAGASRALSVEELEETRAALARFESRVGGWAVGGDTGRRLSEMDEDTRERLRNLGYLE
ncbi:MAG: sulfatase [Natronomonas sp.]